MYMVSFRCLLWCCIDQTVFADVREKATILIAFTVNSLFRWSVQLYSAKRE